MSETEIRCPVCDEVLGQGQAACPRCGFKLIGETQTFEPVTKIESGEANTPGVFKPALEVVKGPYAGESFVMGSGTYTVGRDPGCDIFLSNMTVSRHHATITVEGQQATIVDEGSLNGTWVDGSVVSQAALNPGTHVQIGTFEMVYKTVVD